MPGVNLILNIRTAPDPNLQGEQTRAFLPLAMAICALHWWARSDSNRQALRVPAFEAGAFTISPLARKTDYPAVTAMCLRDLRRILWIANFNQDGDAVTFSIHILVGSRGLSRPVLKQNR